MGLRGKPHPLGGGGGGGGGGLLVGRIRACRSGCAPALVVRTAVNSASGRASRRIRESVRRVDILFRCIEFLDPFSGASHYKELFIYAEAMEESLDALDISHC